MRILFAGTPDVAAMALRRLIVSEHEVIGVLTRPDARKGRGRTLHPSPVAEVAMEYDIPTFKPSTLKLDTEDGDRFREDLHSLAPDCVPVVAYGNLIPEDLLAAVPQGWINLHFSLLPQWRGAAPVQAAIYHGDDITGATTFRIDRGLDTGDVLGTITTEIGANETAAQLLHRLAESGGDLLVATMDGLAGGALVARPQVGEPTYAAKIEKEDAQINWQAPALQIDRQIRAHTPAPGAWTMLADQRMKVGPVVLSEREGLRPGHIEVTKQGVYVGTGSTAVMLGEIQPPGKKMMNAADWARGVTMAEGTVFQ
ncbi:methionyl-tRNA formyltransferase [Corynebacterium epidermidicanis]|uniref:Methionyl-tRNA formyltransferase n=1 Tax=Corynebacterium epidermidicanis TaxID=1050174 RepID=A0A0G3GPZ6_9CORY|nr:methionyl-tRNA formyltransferase [Corynebacterium epidermidicanis]AKK03224.1 methionyl-tRNA formyltransferase [Corynebacterium epidermidicanis]